MDKLGQSSESIFLPIVFALGFTIVSMIAYVIISNMNAIYVSTGMLPASGTDVANNFIKAVAWHDWILVIILVSIIIAGAITNARISTNRAFWIVTFLMAGFYGYVGYFFSYIFSEIVSSAVFTTVLTTFPKSIVLCTNLHWIALIHIIVQSIALYAKREKGQFT